MSSPAKFSLTSQARRAVAAAGAQMVRVCNWRYAAAWRKWYLPARLRQSSARTRRIGWDVTDPTAPTLWSTRSSRGLNNTHKLVGMRHHGIAPSRRRRRVGKLAPGGSKQHLKIYDTSPTRRTRSTSAISAFWASSRAPTRRPRKTAPRRRARIATRATWTPSGVPRPISTGVKGNRVYMPYGVQGEQRHSDPRPRQAVERILKRPSAAPVRDQSLAGRHALPAGLDDRDEPRKRRP